MLITRVLHVMSCCCYHKGTYFQANHNPPVPVEVQDVVVVATTKVRIFKQITTDNTKRPHYHLLLLLPQRYVFSSKSQQGKEVKFHNSSCCCYHKGTYFQANHNKSETTKPGPQVVVATTKVRIFKQITTPALDGRVGIRLLLLPQRYVFSSKSQRQDVYNSVFAVVVATTKVRIFKQITTYTHEFVRQSELLLLPQRYVFSSKSQLRM